MGVRPALRELGLPDDDSAVDLILESLKSISGRLVLQLLSAGSRIQEVVGLGLARLFLRQSGVLSDMFIVPVDAHQQLFRNVLGEGGLSTLSRTDLLLVETRGAQRGCEIHLVEVKTRQAMAGNFIASPLRIQIDEQLANTEQMLRLQFSGGSGAKERFDTALKMKQLFMLMRFYLERARRYALITSEAATRVDGLLHSLEEGYSLGFTRNAVIIDLSTDDSDQIEHNGTIYHLLGRDLLRQLLREQAERIPQPIEAPTSPLLARTRPSFAVPRHTGSARMTIEPIATPATVPVEAGGGTAEADAPERPSDAAPDDEHAPEPGGHADVPYGVLLGASYRTGQYGLLGKYAEQGVALDLNGTNTISLFGVQGSGKSYTLGTIVEMATREIPRISRLRQPLASVIFHYSSDQTYQPEFVSMAGSNSVPSEVSALRQTYGAEPNTLEDILILTPEAKVDERRREFPHLRVEPILFHPQELSVEDWFFLMGAVGNESLYIKKMRQVFRKLRDGLSINALYSAIAGAGLNDSQFQLAKNRIEFAKEFISEQHRIADHVRPGRLVIVDVRDPFYERGEILALFVVLLRVIASARYQGAGYNKLIVLDEAHKYINDRDLVAVVVEAIREMRHKGVSVLIASQDPLSVPTEVIELSTQIVLHKFNSPAWLKHIQKAATALQGLSPGRLNMLRPGEAYVWSTKATDTQFERQAVKIQMRPRVTRHGGETRLATE